ncbi:MAG: protein translocase subunit SecD [Alphaproteobacteria bacterium]|nr:protein translocase subunit SecD [Alphaproteobacteria bacterium]
MLIFPTWKKAMIIIVCAMGVLYAAPNFVAKDTVESIQAVMPDWGPGKQVSLGLDLRGGSYLLVEVQGEDVINERLESNVDAIRRVLRDAKIGYKPAPHVSGGAILFRILDPARTDEVAQQVRGAAPDMVVATGEGGSFSLTYTEQEVAAIKNRTLGQSIEIVRRRIDESGTKEPLIQRQGLDRILIQLPGVDDPEDIKKKIGQTAKMTFHFQSKTMTLEEAQTRGVPPGHIIVPSADNPRNKYLIEKRVIVSGENLIDAQSTFDQNNMPAVSFRFDAVGAQKFGKATQENVDRVFAIVLDGKIISAPVIRTAILGGSGQITGNFTSEETRDLSVLLRAGALPAPLEVIEERTVGAGLGQDSIERGMEASILGLILVLIFMVLAYGLFGSLADVALAFNIALILGALSLFQATLTLPGIAGIVLTIGMAVDANVLIFERIREEARAGRTPVNAIDAGYKRAITTIIDANLTTFIAALLLFIFGAGPVKGFSVTLMIGIVTSMFTAIMVTRLLVVIWVRKRRPAELPI